MTVCVGVAVHDCLVFAADSATTLLRTDPATGQSMVHNVYRHGHKVFNLFKKQPIAAMTCGMGNFGPASIAIIAQDLRQRLTRGGAQWKIDPKVYTIADVAQKARAYIFDECFQSLQPPPPAPLARTASACALLAAQSNSRGAPNLRGFEARASDRHRSEIRGQLFNYWRQRLTTGSRL